jgi:hypothetical protein
VRPGLKSLVVAVDGALGLAKLGVYITLLGEARGLVWLQPQAGVQMFQGAGIVALFDVDAGQMVVGAGIRIVDPNSLFDALSLPFRISPFSVCMGGLNICQKLLLIPELDVLPVTLLVAVCIVWGTVGYHLIQQSSRPGQITVVVGIDRLADPIAIGFFSCSSLFGHGRPPSNRSQDLSSQAALSL